MAANAVRTWARENGYEVGVRGRIAPHIQQAYAAAHGNTIAVEITEHRGPSCTCGRKWGEGAKREAHCATCHCHFSTVRNFDLHRPQGKCAPPESVLDKDGEPKLRGRETVWGITYVGNREHYLTITDDGLFDEEE
jgi:hypothetical protein